MGPSVKGEFWVSRIWAYTHPLEASYGASKTKVKSRVPVASLLRGADYLRMWLSPSLLGPPNFIRSVIQRAAVTNWTCNRSYHWSDLIL